MAAASSSAQASTRRVPHAHATQHEQAKTARHVSPPGRYSRLAGLSALAVAFLLADFYIFGSGGILGEVSVLPGRASYLAEVTLVVSLGLFFVTKYAGAGAPAKQSTPAPVATAAREKVVRGGTSESTTSVAEASERKQPSTEVVKCNEAIDLAAREGDLKKAGQLLLELEAAGFAPEARTYNLVLRACAKCCDGAAAEWWLRRMEQNGVPATVCSYNTLLDAFAKANQAEACERWLLEMLAKGLEANVISYATAIYARARWGDVSASEAWMHKMVAAGIEPDSVSYNSLIHACSVKGDAARAIHWLETMRAKGIETSVSTYTAVVDACAKTGDVTNAERWFHCMLESGVEPNVITYSALIGACAKAGNRQRAEEWHHAMIERGIKPNAHSFSTVIHACAKQGNQEGAEAAEEWLNRSEQAGICIDIVLYSSVIDACGKAGDAERALRVFRRMRAGGLKPHIVAYAALARPFAYRGDWIKVESIAQSMAEDGVKTNEYFVYAHLLAYATSRPRQAEKAEALFRHAQTLGVQANDHIVGILARAVGRTRCLELMQELCDGRPLPEPARRQQERRSR